MNSTYKMSVSEALDHLQHPLMLPPSLILQAGEVVTEAVKLGGFEVHAHCKKQRVLVEKYLGTLGISITQCIYADKESSTFQLSPSAFEITINQLISKFNIKAITQKTKDGDVASFYLNVMGYELGSIHVVRDPEGTYIRLHNSPVSIEVEEKTKEEYIIPTVHDVTDEQLQERYRDLHTELFGTPDNPRTKRYPVM